MPACQFHGAGIGFEACVLAVVVGSAASVCLPVKWKGDAAYQRPSKIINESLQVKGSRERGQRKLRKDYPSLSDTEHVDSTNN